MAGKAPRGEVNALSVYKRSCPACAEATFDAGNHSIIIVLQGAAPLVFGLVLDRGGPQAALLLTSLLTGLSCLALLVLRPGRHSDLHTV